MDFFTKPVPPGEAAIAGVVKDRADQPVPWAAVLISGDNVSRPDIANATNSQGQYRFDGLQPGLYILTVNASGYKPKDGHVTAQLGTLARLDFILG